MRIGKSLIRGHTVSWWFCHPEEGKPILPKGMLIPEKKASIYCEKRFDVANMEKIYSINKRCLVKLRETRRHFCLFLLADD